MPTQKPKILPHNLEAEQSVLGCVFLSTDSHIGIFDNLKPEDFKYYCDMSIAGTYSKAIETQDGETFIY